jgi:hypothetical protein
MRSTFNALTLVVVRSSIFGASTLTSLELSKLVRMRYRTVRMQVDTFGFLIELKSSCKGLYFGRQASARHEDEAYHSTQSQSRRKHLSIALSSSILQSMLKNRSNLIEHIQTRRRRSSSPNSTFEATNDKQRR